MLTSQKQKRRRYNSLTFDAEDYYDCGIYK